MATYITVNSGETIADAVWSSGEIITVAAGGSLNNAELTSNGGGLTLAAGSTVSGTLTVAAPVTVQGSVTADKADIIWDISDRKEEEGLLWSDLAAAAAQSYSVVVDANQDKGTYRIAGNAAAFSGSITIRNAGGMELGAISLANNVLDYDVTRYTLALNAAGELTLNVSSNITDDSYYLFLYKDNKLVTPLAEGYELIIDPKSDYDHLVVIENGLAGNVTLKDNGVLTAYAGAMVIGVNQGTNGKLRFDYSAGDSTIITGLNAHGSFVVQNDELLNVCGENVNLSGKVKVVDYHSLGVFTAIDGVDISGTFTVASSGKATFKNGTTIHDCTITGNYINFEKGVTVSNTAIGSGSYRYFRGGEYTNVTINGSNNYFYGGTYSNVTISSGYLYGYIDLAGTLTVDGSLTRNGSGYLDANGNTIVLDMTKRKISDGALLPGAYVSEDALFQLNLLDKQGIGTYQLLGKDDLRSKYSFALYNSQGLIGTLTHENQTLDAGNFVYSMTSGKELTISISENADDTFNVLTWHSDGTFDHAAELSGAVASSTDYTQIIVRKNGLAGDVVLKSGGLLEVYNSGMALGIDQRSGGALRFDYAAGDTTLITGLNQYGMFMVQDDSLINVVGENVNLSGEISVQDYRSTGLLTAADGAAFTGVLDTGSKEAVFGREKDSVADVKIVNATVSGSKKTFYAGVTVSNSTIGGSYTYFRGGEYTNVTVNGSSNYFYGGTFSNSIWTGGILCQNSVQLAGTLTITGNVSSWGGNINAHGNTIVLDYTRRTAASGAIIALNRVSEDVVFQVALRDDQAVGTYTICSNAGSFVDTFQITIDGDIIGTINNQNRAFDYGNYSYSMSWDNISQNILLTIDVSENADENFNVLCYDKDNVLSYAPEMTTVTVDGSNCAKVTIRNGGVLANAQLQNGLLTIRKGGMAYGLNQSANGKLRFDYAEGDSTLITGLNQYGSFFVQDDSLINVVGENVNISGNVLVQDYHSMGTFTADGATITDNFYGSGTFKNSKINNANITGTATVSGNSTVSNTTVAAANFSGGYFESVTVKGSATLSGGTYYDVNLAGGGSIRGRIALEGCLTVGNKVECVSSYSVNGAIDAAGAEVNLDLTERTPISETLINLNRVYNADLTLTVYANQTLGTYSLGTNAGNLGVGDNEGFWDIDTNTWLYKNAVEGDLDGVITIRSDQGIELARCTVNGATEYFGRYNYRVYTDEENVLKLRIGWNNRDDVTFADDGVDNNTLDTATVITTSGVSTQSGMTIHDENDVDYYKFTLERSGSAASNITIEFKQWAGDLDIDLLDANGNRIDYAHSVTDNETLSLRGLAAGDYYVKVYGSNGETNGYTLTANLPEKPDFKDDYENGDDFCYLGEIKSDHTIKAAISESGDEDNFSFILDRSGKGTDGVTLTFDPEYGDLDLYLYDKKGKHLLSKSVESSGGEETISFQGLAKGAYVIKVVAKNGQDTADYKLNFTVRDEEELIKNIKADKYENNNTLKKAKNLYALHGKDKNKDLTIHSSSDVDYFKFKLKETGTADDWIAIDYEACFGDLDIEILNEKGEVVAYSRTSENTDQVSLKGLAAGDYYIRVYGYEGMVNFYDMSWSVNNSKLIASDCYEGGKLPEIRQNQKITGLTIAQKVKDDETREDTFAIQLDHDAWRSTKIMLSGFRGEWADGMKWKISRDPEGKDVIHFGVGSEISLANFKKGRYYLTVDAPEEDSFSEYELIAQNMPDGTAEPEKNAWSIFVYLAGDNNLEGAYLNELLWMQQAVLPQGVEVYVLMDRSGEYSEAERNWSDTRVGKIVHSPGGAVAVQWMYFEGEDTSVYMNTSNLELKKEWDTGNVETLQAFLNWGMKVGAADNYALIMKDHGTSLGYNSSDETSGSIMNITDIADLLAAPEYDELKVVAFDQCLMGSDVVISTMEGNVDYVVASESVGYTPNQLVMYKVLFNSLTADMTAQELAQKIVKSCNCSGRLDLTSASFHAADATLSEALNEFAAASAGFSRSDWVTVCKSFAMAYNYGDDICAYSDLGFLLSSIKNAPVAVSDNLLEAVNALYETVINELVDSTMITPASYGSGLAIFNPVLSDDLMSFYSYGPGADLDYYGTAIGQSQWGEFLYTVGQLAEDCTEYFVDNSSQITFTDFTYSFADDAVQVNYNLGTFYGSGVKYNGIYIDDKMYFTITLDNAGIAGDLIRISADNPEADITMTLVQQRPDMYGNIEIITRRISENGVLSLAGIDNDNAGVLTEYFLIVSTDAETTYDLSFEASWSSGSDYFDYSRSGNKLGRQGNGSIDKAVVLAAGNYGGLVTYKGDADYYQLKTVYSNEIDVVITGSGLTVCEYDANGKLIHRAIEADGKYLITVANGNYLYVEGEGDVEQNVVNSYSMSVSDVAHTYLAPTGGVAKIPALTVLQDTTAVSRQVVITAETAAGNKTFWSKDLKSWTEFTGSCTLIENGLYYFKAADPDSLLESSYKSLEITNIDRVAPAKPVVSADIVDWTKSDVTVSAEFAGDSILNEYRIADGAWQAYTGSIVLKSNATVSFRSSDEAGNVSEIAEYVVNYIDKTAPEKPKVQADITDLTNKDVYVSAIFAEDSIRNEYRIASGEWQLYTGSVRFTGNGTVEFRSTDAVGNTSETAVYTVDNIDKTAPEKPQCYADITTVTRQDVVVSAIFAADSIRREYKIDNGQWQAYTTGVVMSSNGSVSFRSFDAAGNSSAVAEYKVGNIDRTPPENPVASADIESLTNKNVTVTAEFAADSVKNEYRINSGEWLIYNGGIVFEQNGAVEFRSTDAAGNISEKTEYIVDYIDKVAEDKPVASADITTVTNGNVTVSAAFSAGSVIRQYSLDGDLWENYITGIVLEQNGTVYFRSIDEAGNESEVTEYRVNNIDKIAPAQPEISLDVTTLTNGNVTVNAKFAADSVKNEYRINSGEWLVYNGDIVFEQNGSIEFRSTDAAGNISQITPCEISNIDKTPPADPVIQASTLPTNQPVTVTAIFADDAVVKKYRINSGEWQDYTNGVVMSDNGIVEFYAQDAAGNASAIVSCNVNNIDKAAPALRITGNAADWTNKDVVLQAVTDDNSAVVEYSFDNKNWVKGTSVTVTENKDVYFRVSDTAGNVTSQTVTVDKIDKTDPEKPVASANIVDLTNQNVAVSAVFDKESVKNEYKRNDGNWQIYNGAVIMEANGTVEFRSTDAAGNVSLTTVYSVENIDKIAPDQPVVSADITTATNKAVTVSAVFSSDSVAREYSLDGQVWYAYKTGIVLENNGSVLFRSKDEAGNYSSITQYTVNNIDRIAPSLEITGNAADWTNKDVLLQAVTDDKNALIEYSFDNKNWIKGISVTVTENKDIYFRVTDTAGNVTSQTVTVDKIDKTAPEKPIVAVDNEDYTSGSVTVSAEFADDSIKNEYKINDGNWSKYTSAVKMDFNGTVYFRSSDRAGNFSYADYTVRNIDTDAPNLPGVFKVKVDRANATVEWNECQDNGVSDVKGYYFRYGKTEDLTGAGEFVSGNMFDLQNLELGTWYYQVCVQDNAGNISGWSDVQTFEVTPYAPDNIRAGERNLYWDDVPGAAGYTVEYSKDNFVTIAAFDSASNGINVYNLPAGEYQCRVKAAGDAPYCNGEFIAYSYTVAPQKIASDKNSYLDVFFASRYSVWGYGYSAQHFGSLNGWDGTLERISLTGKNKIADIFAGSQDANILLLTDDANGDALFVDDIYTALPGTVAEQQARISQIDEIRAGAGNDIVDLTSQRFDFFDHGVTVYGGDGSDTIWANNGENILFGDAGNDRIVGADGNDVIVGGSGNDSMHGGGGSDIFVFGGNWGNDIIEQLDGGSVTLWLENGSDEYWDEEKLIYSDGTNSITVSGVSEVELRFGADAELPEGVFSDAASEKIFEDKEFGILA